MAHNRRLGPAYKGRYERLKLASPFLNPRARERNFHEYAWHLDSKAQLQGRIEQIEEVVIPEHESQIAALEEAFKHASQAAVNAGRRPLKEMAPDMRERWEEANAALDIAREEADEIRKAIEKAQEVEQERSDGAVLKRGPEGSGQLRGGVLVLLDGQTVKPDVVGVLRIADERSPYNGMTTADYYDHVCMPWKHAQAKRLAEAHKKARELNVPVSEIACGREPMPPWPDCVPRPGARDGDPPPPKKARRATLTGHSRAGAEDAL